MEKDCILEDPSAIAILTKKMDKRIPKWYYNLWLTPNDWWLDLEVGMVVGTIQ